jgi:hypothetical protein
MQAKDLDIAIGGRNKQSGVHHAEKAGVHTEVDPPGLCGRK